MASAALTTEPCAFSSCESTIAVKCVADQYGRGADGSLGMGAGGGHGLRPPNTVVAGRPDVQGVFGEALRRSPYVSHKAIGSA